MAHLQHGFLLLAAGAHPQRPDSTAAGHDLRCLATLALLMGDARAHVKGEHGVAQGSEGALSASRCCGAGTAPPRAALFLVLAQASQVAVSAQPLPHPGAPLLASLSTGVACLPSHSGSACEMRNTIVHQCAYKVLVECGMSHCWDREMLTMQACQVLTPAMPAAVRLPWGQFQPRALSSTGSRQHADGGGHASASILFALRRIWGGVFSVTSSCASKQQSDGSATPCQPRGNARQPPLMHRGPAPG